jgi:hypothetical protein
MKKENEVFDQQGFSLKMNGISHDLQKVNRVSKKLLELTNKTATSDHLLKVMEPGRLLERQATARGVFFALVNKPGIDGDDPTLKEFLNFLMNVPAGLTVLPAYHDRLSVNPDGTVQLDAAEEIKAQFTHTLTEKQLKVKRWSERWLELMNEPIAREIGFINGVRSLPLTVTDDRGTLKVNDNQIIKY